MSDDEDELLEALTRATRRNYPDEQQEPTQATGDGLSIEQQLALGNAMGGAPLALNDDAGLARRLGMTLGHNTHFSN